MNGFLHDELSELLARKAKELIRGMRERVNRDPDIADFKAGFDRVALEWWKKKSQGDKVAEDPASCSSNPR